VNDILKNLQITTWYKAVIAVSGPALLIVLTTQRDTLAILFGGILLIAIGEWKNHPRKEVELRPTPIGQWAKITDIPRKQTWFGTLLQLLGLALIVYAGCRALGLSLPF
jgi:hypothetical protein